MSLDVSLYSKEATKTTCHCCGHEKREHELLFDSNITHNLGHMASQAGIYKIVWRPDENGITQAEQLIIPLTRGIELLKSKPERFKQFNSSNGWGLYENFVPWCEKYLNACIENPDATVHVSR